MKLAQQSVLRSPAVNESGDNSSPVVISLVSSVSGQSGTDHVLPLLGGHGGEVPGNGGLAGGSVSHVLLDEQVGGLDMGFVIPFDTAVESPNLFVKQDVAYTAEGKTPVSWNFPTMPSEEWKNGVGSALTAYAADQTDDNWAAVVTAFVDGWASEYALLG